jgi:Zn-dependent peptidase ImmA (M78 family)
MTTTEQQETVMPDYAGAERKAEAILAQVNIDTAPVNPIAVAKRLGYSVNASLFRDSSTSGRVSVRDGKVRIDVNASDPPTRFRYTIAHEIGHALLHLNAVESGELTDSEEMFRNSSQGFRPAKEAEADRFAAALLMPATLVREKFQGNQDEKALARYFAVSPQAMHIRLEHLDLIPR